MDISMKDLFSRKNIQDQVISLRNSLSNHPDGLKLGLREAASQLKMPANGDGFNRGCRLGNSLKLDLGVKEKEFGEVVPQWVAVAGKTRPGQKNSDADFLGETRTVEGVLNKSKITHEDFPLKPWHTYYDWNFHIDVDTQYTYLLSPANEKGDFECEWDTAFFPSWVRPHKGERIWMVGRWIYDCGHPKNGKHRSEIHPPKALVVFRSEAAKFTNNKGFVRANNALLFIGRDGGYWRQPINNQNYEFDLYLPPKPFADAKPLFRIQSKLQKNKRLPVEPVITAYPTHDPRVLRIVIPLKGLTPHPEEYSAIISAGWNDPRNTESKKIQQVRIDFENINVLNPHEDQFFSKTAEWELYIGVNQVWKKFNFKIKKGETKPLNFTVDLNLHSTDKIRITACGLEADAAHKLMGKSTGLTWATITNTSGAIRGKVGKKIAEKFLSLGTALRDEGLVENDPIGIISIEHNISKVDTFGKHKSEGFIKGKKDYKLTYTIKSI